MAIRPRPIHSLPGTPAQDTDQGARTAVTTRIVIVATVVLGQLFALTIALEVYLLDHNFQAWLLAGFSVLSFAVVLALTRVDPPPRASRLRGRAATESGGYVPRPVEDRSERR